MKGALGLRAAPVFPSITAWEKDGLRVAFDFSKAAASPEVTDIDATYTNSGVETASDFALQVSSPACPERIPRSLERVFSS